MAKYDLNDPDCPMQYKNLKPIKDHETAVAMGKKGGPASVKAKREKKNQREAMLMLLGLKLKSKKAQETLSEMGIKKGDMTYQTLELFTLLQEAIKGKNVRAMELIHKITVTKDENEERNSIDEVEVEDLSILEDLLK